MIYLHTQTVNSYKGRLKVNGKYVPMLIFVTDDLEYRVNHYYADYSMSLIDVR
jgi:hypothetical protein